MGPKVGGRGRELLSLRPTCWHVPAFSLLNQGIWTYIPNIFSYSSLTYLAESTESWKTNLARFKVTEKGQKAIGKAEYNTKEGEGKEKLEGLSSGSKMCSIDWQYLSLVYLEQNEIYPKSKS